MKTDQGVRLLLFLVFFALNACHNSGVSRLRDSSGNSQELSQAYPLEPEFEDQSTPPTPPYPPPPPPPPTLTPEDIARRNNRMHAEPEPNTEEYSQVQENDFQEVTNRPLSTFSVDVDRASYANVRRFLRAGQWPAAGAVRIEEMINYFDYSYMEPSMDVPFSVQAEIFTCPWNTEHQLLRIGLKGRSIPASQIPASNLVFLLDVSGSMNDANKLPLLKKAFGLLTRQLRKQDRVAIVVYAGASGVVLPSTSGDQKLSILEALEKLNAGGSTAGAEGITLAYKVARENFLPQGNNRIILATDGDFNVGLSSEAALVEMIEKERADGIFLSIFGFGSGNYKDAKMEQLADNGNGNYAYIDNLAEAQKVLVTEFSSTLFTIAKDVKLQLEFNPAHVQSYRLIGYENRVLQDRDFNDDKKDAGEIGAGHTVTALYELVPAGAKNSATVAIDPLQFQETTIKATAANDPNWVSLKLRYKPPQEEVSQLLQFYAANNGKQFDQSSEDTRFATAVAAFGMLLKQSKYSGDLTFDQVKNIAQASRGADKEGYRAEFVQLVELAKGLAPTGK